MGIGQILSYATRRIKPNQIRIRKRELDASNNRSFASEFVSSDYEVTGLVSALKGMTLSFDLVPTEQFLKAHRLLKCALKLVLYGNFRAKFLCVNSLKSKK